MDVNGLWNTVKTKIVNSSRQPPSTIAISDDHVIGAAHHASFKSDTDYFRVTVNEMYLTNARQWFTHIEPVVYVLAQFVYNSETQVVPVLVGPTLLKNKGIPENVAQGIVFRNTTVAGPFPYRGKGLVLAVILCEARSSNPLKPLLGVIENTSAALGFAPMTAVYTSLAKVLIDGFDALVNSGGVTPIAGLNDSYGPNYGTRFRPSYFALIDAPNVRADTLWVRDNRLLSGPSRDDATEFRAADFVLYSIGGIVDNHRDDIDLLPFRELWQRVQKEAASPVEDPNYKNAKALMATLFQELLLSPDLTEPQGDELADEYQKRMEEIHTKAKKIGAMAGGEPDTGRVADARTRALQILNS